MNPTKNMKVTKEQGSFPLISNYLKGFLRKETLRKEDVINHLLENKREDMIQGEESRAEILRRYLDRISIRDLSELLSRPLYPFELLFLFESIEKFIRLTMGKVTAITEEEE